MTRQDILKYIDKTHGAALAQVGLMAIDSAESLHYVIDDALTESNDDKRKKRADVEIATLIRDRRDMLGIDDTNTDSHPAVEEIENVSNE